MKKLLFLFVLILGIQNSVLANGLSSKFVSSSWLDGWMNDKSINSHLIIIDSRSEKKYKAGHIPGAINLPVSKTFEKNARKNFIAPVSELREMFSAAGLDLKKDVLVYDDGELIDAARMIWILETFGHSNVSILNGGYKNWINLGYAHSDKPVLPQPSLFIPSITPERLANRLNTRMAIDNEKVTIVDARSNKEYMGLESKAARKGHIPTAVNIPWDDHYTKLEDGRILMKSRDELEVLYQNVDKKSKVIAYCNKGKQSALSHLVMRELGFDVAAYDGSWFEWGNDYSLPIELDPTIKSP